MGSCFSRSRSRSRCRCRCSSRSGDSTASTAKVISMEDGQLRQYPTPVLVSQVLSEITFSSSSSSSSSSSFLSNMDSFYYDEIIPALSSEDQLRPNQIYFLLPISMRQQPLSASDMASLAVKASAALDDQLVHIQHRRRNNSSSVRVSPLIVSMFGRSHNTLISKHDQEEDTSINENDYVHPPDYAYDLTIGLTGRPIKKNKSTATPETMSRPRSVRKLQRFASRRAKLAVRSFRLRLTTIYEGTILS